MTDKNNSLACRKRRTTAEISINYTQQKCYNIWIRLQRRVILRNGTNGKCKLSSPLEFQYDKYMNAGPNNWFTFSWLVFKQTNHREVKHSNKSKPAWLGNVFSFCSCFSSRTEGKFPSRAREYMYGDFCQGVTLWIVLQTRTRTYIHVCEHAWCMIIFHLQYDF